ncbi:hypothetical protein A2U01_0001719 [Trifolium medium]|uniref:Uncharacterized protein n=1 Tax=Trifolium medium TaxID=97028 RepID=A0A392M1Q3_9FABA|nr:hypothetical protein [Trifolium medium]
MGGGGATTLTTASSFVVFVLSCRCGAGRRIGVPL